MFDATGLNPTVTMVTNMPGYVNKSFSYFGDEGNPISVERIQPKDYTLSLNCRLVHWTKPVAYVVTFSVLAGSSDDTYLKQLLCAEAPRPLGLYAATTIVSLVYKVGRAHSANGPLAALEKLTPSAARSVLPDDGGTFTTGFILDGEVAPSVAADGKKQMKTYTMVFENFVPFPA